jgi:hypothetical protein
VGVEALVPLQGARSRRQHAEAGDAKPDRGLGIHIPAPIGIRTRMQIQDYPYISHS